MGSSPQEQFELEYIKLKKFYLSRGYEVWEDEYGDLCCRPPGGPGGWTKLHTAEARRAIGNPLGGPEYEYDAVGEAVKQMLRKQYPECYQN